MGYYDNDEYYDGYYEYDDPVEPVSLIMEGFTESSITDVLASAGLIVETKAKFHGTMEKLVFMHGEGSEVYSSAEIRFIERIDDVLVYPDFTKRLSQGNMICRTIATKFNCCGHDALIDCIFFEKIIDKALDGFNIFLFLTEDSIFFGCRFFDRTGKRSCTLSKPIDNENRFEQVLDELTWLIEMDSFTEYYDYYHYVITADHNDEENYETLIMRRRGVQMAYLEEIRTIEHNMGLDMSNERERYCQMFDDAPEKPFSSLIEEAEESLAFIKSTRVNTYEMLFEADEMMRKAEQAETDNERLVETSDNDGNGTVNHKSDQEAQALLDNPEEMIKLLKKRRGL